ncbi:MAG: DUF6585 family protein [Pirellulaceae bacterium]
MLARRTRLFLMALLAGVAAYLIGRPAWNDRWMFAISETPTSADVDQFRSLSLGDNLHVQLEGTQLGGYVGEPYEADAAPGTQSDEFAATWFVVYPAGDDEPMAMLRVGSVRSRSQATTFHQHPRIVGTVYSLMPSDNRMPSSVVESLPESYRSLPWLSDRPLPIWRPHLQAGAAAVLGVLSCFYLVTALQRGANDIAGKRDDLRESPLISRHPFQASSFFLRQGRLLSIYVFGILVWYFVGARGSEAADPRQWLAAWSVPLLYWTAACAAAFVLVRSWQLQFIAVHEEGIVWQRLGLVRAVRWDDVVALYRIESVRSIRYFSRWRTEDDEAAEDRTLRRKLRLAIRNGSSLVVHEVLKDYDDLIANIESLHGGWTLAQMQKTLLGGKLSFGKIEVDVHGISIPTALFGRRRLAWGDIQRTAIAKRRLCVFAQGERHAATQIPIAQLPNYHVLLRILQDHSLVQQSRTLDLRELLPVT